MPSDDVSIRIRARGGRQAAREVGGVERALGSLGRSARGATGGMRMFGRATVSSSGQMRVAAGAMGVGQTALAALGAIAVKSGLQFNASMEQNQIAFQQFLGSASAARSELGTLYSLAKATPFEFPQLTQAARKFLAFGFNVKQANSLLGTVGDAAAGAGLGADAIDRMVLSLGQIRSKGRLQAEELLQLQELGVLDTSGLRKHLGLTAKQMANIGTQGVGANKAIRAIQATLDDTFAGQSAKQAQSFNGQMSTLRDNLNQTLGTITKPLFNRLKRNVLPALNDTAGRINDIFSRKDLSLEQKLTLSRTAARHRLGPLVHAVRDEIGRMRLGDKIANAFEAGVPRVADAAGRAAPKVAGAFARGFLHAGPYGKMFAAAVIAKKLGVFSLLGGLAADRFTQGWRRGQVPGAPGPGGAPGGRNRGRLTSRLGRVGRTLPWVATAAAVGWELGDALHDTAVGRGARRLIGNDPASTRRKGEARLRAQGRVQIAPHIWTSAAGARRERALAPQARGTVVHHTTIVKTRDREIGRANDRFVADERARNRRH